MISRRGFLKRLGIGAGAVAGAGIAPYLPEIVEKAKVTPASTIRVVSDYGRGTVTTEFIAGAKIKTGQIVAIQSDGKVYPMDFSDTKQVPIGVAIDDMTILMRGIS